jgi:flagellin
MSSIMTNTGSMVALQTLKSINKGMGQVQNEISTGLRVSNAKDNSSSWSIAATMKSDVNSYKKLGESLTSASAMVGVARTAAEQISGLLVQIQEKVVQGKNPDADATKLNAEITALSATITSISASAQYNGINMVKATPDSATLTVSVIRDGTGALTLGTMAVAGVDLAATVTTAITTATTVDAVDTLIDTANAAAAAFGAAQARIDAQNTFLGKQMDALKNGVGAMIDADMEEASARLTALQTQQQLGIQALSIANQAPQSILSLFRG